MDFTPLPHGSIVVGIDGSPQALLALDWATRQAALDRRPLTLVHAAGPRHPVWLGPPAMDLDDLHLVEDREARSIMQAATYHARSLEPGVEVHQVLSRSDPRQELLDHAEHAAMVVVGSRGRGPVGSLLLGSVSVAVSTHAACPVVVLRPASSASTEGPRLGVLVGVQGADIASAALETAFGLASSRSLPLTVLQCFWDTRHGSVDQAFPAKAPVAGTEPPRGSSTQATEQEALGDVVAALSKKLPDVVVSGRQRRGYVDRLLVELSPSMDAVVVGSRRPDLLRRAVFGSLAHTVVEHAQGAVVIVPLPAD